MDIQLHLCKHNRILAQINPYRLSIPLLLELHTRGYSLRVPGTGHKRR